MEDLASMTFEDKFNRTVKMFKDHGLKNLFTNFLIIIVSWAIFIGIAVAAIPFE